MMPRGKRKIGQYDCTIWFGDGYKVRMYSDGTRNLTDVEIRDALKSLVDLLDKCANRVALSAVETPR
jgi:hypothetical protein